MWISRRTFLSGMTAAILLPLSALAGNRAVRNLILIELKGANDGLNTLVPYEADAYHALRPTIGLASQDVLAFGQDQTVGPLGLHGELAALEDAIGQDLALIQGVGYPNQNRSHFKSIALWESGGDGNRPGSKGWLTETLEKSYPIQDISAHGASFQGSLGLFARGSGTYISMERIAQLAEVQAGEMTASKNRLINLIAKRKSELAEVSRRINQKLDAYPERRLHRRMPHNQLGEQLRDALRVIGAEANIPVLHVQQGGYDTHENQSSRHSRLMNELAASLAALRANLIHMDHWHDTLVMTYSEFGRRAAENGAQGTDHGTASVQFLMGGRVKPGLYGNHPDLDQLQEDDLQFTLDYRAVYDEVCAIWFGDNTNPWSSYRNPALAGVIGT